LSVVKEGPHCIAWTHADESESGRVPSEALRDQLGLKLEAREAPVDYLVIDHAERPTAN
jgi:uncharacterized protein (TIGR03435 family)